MPQLLFSEYFAFDKKIFHFHVPFCNEQRDLNCFDLTEYMQRLQKRGRTGFQLETDTTETLGTNTWQKCHGPYHSNRFNGKN